VRAPSSLRFASSSANRARSAWSASFVVKRGPHQAETSLPSPHFSAKADTSLSCSPLVRRVRQPKLRNHHRAAPRRQTTHSWQSLQTTSPRLKRGHARDGRGGTTNGVNSSPPPCRQNQRRTAAARNTQRSRTPQLIEPPKRCSPSVEGAARAVGCQRVDQQPAWFNQAVTQEAAKQSAALHEHAQNAALVQNQKLNTLALSVEPRPPRGCALRRNGSPAQLSGASRGSPRALKSQV